MLNPDRDHLPRSASAAPSGELTDATLFANAVAAEFEKWETGSLAGLYHFFGRALTSYRKYRNDAAAYEELLDLDYIAGLREKPDVMDTSRLVLYKLTTAQDGARRNAAGRYARVVDYLFQQRVKERDAVKYVEEAGGQDAILKLARGHSTPKDADRDESVHEDLEHGEEGEQDEDTDLNGIIEGDPSIIFNPETDVAIRLTDGTHAKILSDDFPLKKTFFLQCRKLYVDEQGWVRVVGRLRTPRGK